MTPQEALRYHVTGAIERGEAVAIVERPVSQRQQFMDALAIAYRDLFATNSEYAYSAARISPEALALKMTNGLQTGAANKDGEGIKRACKACGVKYTYAAIREFLIH